MKYNIGLGFIGLMMLVGANVQAQEAVRDPHTDDARAKLHEEIASPIQGEYAVGNASSYSSPGNYTKGDVGGYSGNGFITGGGQVGTYPPAPTGSGSAPAY